MKAFRFLVLLSTLALGAVAAVAANPAAAPERALKIDRSKSYVDIDVKATLHKFTGRLERYELTIPIDAAGKIKDALLQFKFTDLKTGNGERDEAMIHWLGGGEPAGAFDLGLLALTPDGQGQASGKLTFNGQTQLVEFPVNVRAQDGIYTVTGQTTFDYRNWGLKIFRKFGVAKVDPEVTVRFQFVGELPASAEE
jgi:polyisoprenoid-binding protein YceI